MITRARLTGHRVQRDLARAVGCRVEQVSRWAQLVSPPVSMRKGFDASLARALQTTHEMLFEQWVHTPPDKAERVLLHTDQFFGKSRDELLLLTDIDQVLVEVSRRLWKNEVKGVLEYAVKLVLARNDERAGEFRELAERFKMFEPGTSASMDDVRQAIPRGEMWLHPGGPPGPLQPSGRTKKRKTPPRTIKRATLKQNPKA